MGAVAANAVFISRMLMDTPSTVRTAGGTQPKKKRKAIRRRTSKRSPDVLVEHPMHIYECKECSTSFVAVWVNRSHHFGIEVSHREPPRFCPYCGAPLKEKIRFETGGERG